MFIDNLINLKKKSSVRKMKHSNKKAFTIIELVVVILVMGVLVAAITESRVLMEQAKVKAAQRMASNSPVLGILDDDGQRSVVAWFDAFNTEDITVASGLVSEWRSRVGNVALSQTTGTRQPDYMAEGITYFPAVDFDGADDFLWGMPILRGGDDTYTLAAVFWADILKTSVVYEQGTSTATGGRRSAILLGDTGIMGFVGQSADFKSMPYSAGRANSVVIVVDDGETSIYLNNGAVLTGSLSSSTLNIGSAQAVMGRKIGSAEYLDGKISEVIVFQDALQADDIAAVRKYLNTRYNIK